jgi:hypothetical protein
MRKSLGLICSLLLLAACHRKNSDGSPVGIGSLPGMCTAYAPKVYTGAVVHGACGPGFTEPVCGHHYQTIAVEADVTHYPNDSVDVILIQPDGSTRSLPNPHVTLGVKTVTIVDGEVAGFTSYRITETLCR